jgi:hypothetical protein
VGKVVINYVFPITTVGSLFLDQAVTAYSLYIIDSPKLRRSFHVDMALERAGVSTVRKAIEKARQVALLSVEAALMRHRYHTEHIPLSLSRQHSNIAGFSLLTMLRM